MRDAMIHRGPDGAGILELPGATVAHRRLSIIDLAHGDQPMSNEDGSIWVTFNGEIYNFRELEAQLSAAGHRFKTRCDTEVLVHAYEEYGDDFVRRLNGMFAFALVDLKRQRVLLARDHLGIKPLFYARLRDGLAFASEIKGVLPALEQVPSLRGQSLQEYLIFRYVAWDRTFYEDVYRLPPAHIAIWQSGQLSIRRYWSPSMASARDHMTLSEASQALEQHLATAVEQQLMSDVPLGSFCSGGVDSGLVTAYAARSSTGFQSFSVGFDDPAWDETDLARDSARRAGTTHHVVVAQAGDVEATLHRLIHFHDEPLSHPNSLGLYTLSELARRHVKVVLTGEGADELFGGYPRYHLARLRGAFEGVPDFARAGAAALLRSVRGRRASKAAALLSPSFEDSIVFNSAYVDPGLVAELTGGSVTEAVTTRRHLLRESRVRSDAIATISRYELLTYLPCLLDRMDRMSMAHSLEGRVPFLDVNLVEWALGLGTSLKLGPRSNKRVVKHLAANLLNPRIVRGPKSGFGLPLDSWFRSPELSRIVERLRDPHHPAAAHFDQKIVQRALQQHLGGVEKHGELLWLLANVYLWQESQPASIARPTGLRLRATA